MKIWVSAVVALGAALGCAHGPAVTPVVAPGPAAGPGPPVDFQVSEAGPYEGLLLWWTSPSDDFHHYELTSTKVGVGSGEPVELEKRVTAVRLDFPASEGESWVFQLRAVGSGPGNDTATSTYRFGLRPPFVRVRQAESGERGVRLEWSPSSPLAERVVIERALDPGDADRSVLDFVRVAVVSDRELGWVDTSAEPGRSYVYRLWREGRDLVSRKFLVRAGPGR